MFVRHDAVRRPLQPVHDGPFKVIRRLDKTFKIHTPRGEQEVSIDRLKPAFIFAADAGHPGSSQELRMQLQIQ